MKPRQHGHSLAMGEYIPVCKELLSIWDHEIHKKEGKIKGKRTFLVPHVIQEPVTALVDRH